MRLYHQCTEFRPTHVVHATAADVLVPTPSVLVVAAQEHSLPALGDGLHAGEQGLP